MSNNLFALTPGATPLSLEEQEGLIPSWIATREDLNAAEEANIEDAVIWMSRRRSPKILTEAFVKHLHSKMFGDVWRWAGSYRTTGKNIGVDLTEISMRLRGLFDDVAYWTKEAVYSQEEIAVRLHHRLVFIHPFANGNGRHARLLADIFIQQYGGKLLTWGQVSLVTKSETRDAYIAALKSADNHDIEPLMTFATS